MEGKVFLLLLIAISSFLVICNAGSLRHKITITKHDEIVKDGLKEDFYKTTCPRAEEIVKNITERHVISNPKMAAKLLRLLYHDCFVRGCDGSILLDSTPNLESEKEAGPNSTLEGFDVIDEIKEELEKECKQTVSCADTLALAARDAVSFSFGRPLWKVPTGRRDGTISNATEARLGLPKPNSNFTTLKDNFALNNLDVQDLVTLSGAHTIGVAHCGGFRKRLFNFTGVGDQDPSFNSAYATFLKAKCLDPSDRNTTVTMDPEDNLASNTEANSVSFDNHYYFALKEGKGLFKSDAELLTDKTATGFVEELLKLDSFLNQFAVSMQKMGALQVLTGTQGEIRKKCNVIN